MFSLFKHCYRVFGLSRDVHSQSAVQVICLPLCNYRYTNVNKKCYEKYHHECLVTLQLHVGE